MTDLQAKRALKITIVVGLLLGTAWAWSQYGDLLDARSWSLMGLTLIFSVAGFAGVFALLQARKKR